MGSCMQGEGKESSVMVVGADGMMGAGRVDCVVWVGDGGIGSDGVVVGDGREMHAVAVGDAGRVKGNVASVLLGGGRVVVGGRVKVVVVGGRL